MTSGQSGENRSLGARLPRPEGSLISALVDPPLRLVEWAFGLDEIDRMANEAAAGRPAEGEDTELMARILRATRIAPRIHPDELARIPASGPVLCCSNHPLGGADSTALLGAVVSRRADTKILANSLMARFPFLAQYCIFVDPFGGRDAARRNAAALREALDWLKKGGALVAFPAGEVSAIAWGRWTPADPPWSTVPARLALKSGAKIVPIWCEGTNRGVFHAAGLVHPRLRTALLPAEFISRQGTSVEFRVGRALSTEGLALDAESLTRLVRGRCELLRRGAPAARAAQTLAEIAPCASTAEQLAAEFDALPPEALLSSDGDFRTYAVRTAQIPRAFAEIGRLREIAYRAVGEGSGKPSDTDRFDPTYWQIVVWHAANREIVGGYRIGVVDELLRTSGVDGLYSATLFEYAPELVEELRDAVELGRSFVRLEYQRQPLPLSLLWKGIGLFLLRHGLSRMFGPVSISNDYDSTSKELIMEFLERHRLAAPFARQVRPRTPPERRGIPSWTEQERAVAASDFGQLERLVDEIERGKRAVPVLLRHYLRLNARLLAFNLDRDFGDVVDALMLVDMRQIDERIVRYYLGSQAAPDDGVSGR